MHINNKAEDYIFNRQILYEIIMKKSKVMIEQ